MQQRPPFSPSAAFNFLLAAVLGIPGLYDLVTGIMRIAPGFVLTGLGTTAYAVLLVRDALHLRKTGQPALPRPRMARLAFVCLGVYLLGIILKFVLA